MIPDVGLRPVMLGGGTVTVKLTPLLATPPTVTTTFPVVAPLGTGTTMVVPLQLVGVAAVPLNVTVLVPCVPPKLAPVIVTDAPTNPDVGFRLAMLGAGVALFTLTGTPALVAVFPEVSVATAANVWLPLGSGCGDGYFREHGHKRGSSCEREQRDTGAEHCESESDIRIGGRVSDDHWRQLWRDAGNEYSDV